MAGLKEGKVLIVDDDKSVCDFLQRFLKAKGYTDIMAVDTGQAALKVVEKKDIKLVLLDIRLPDIDGIEVLKKIKEIKKDTSVVMITGFPEEEKAKAAVKEGAYDYIVKPFDLAYLELCVFSKISGMA